MTTQIDLNVSWLSEFKKQAQTVGATIHEADGVSEAAARLVELAASKEQTRLAVAPSQLARPDKLWQLFLQELEGKLELAPLETASEIAACPLGLSYADLGVAETGSLVFANNDLSARLVAMLTYIHIAVLPAERMIAGLDEVGVQLRHWQAGKGDRRYISMVTGPSRTADIERVLTIGVQGPQELHIILVS